MAGVPYCVPSILRVVTLGDALGFWAMDVICAKYTVLVNLVGKYIFQDNKIKKSYYNIIVFKHLLFTLITNDSNIEYFISIATTNVSSIVNIHVQYMTIKIG